MARLLILLVSSLALQACIHNPYLNRVVTDSSGNPQKYAFAYGKFCGGGYPTEIAGYPGGRTQQLRVAGVPVDDIDAVCYAHDQCYALGTPTVCDSALHSMLIDYQTEFASIRCWNLDTDMVIAFFGKVWGRGQDTIATTAHSVAGSAIGLPSALFWAALKLPLRPFVPFPREGDCRLKQAPTLEETLVRFERQYRESGLAARNESISLPRPLSP